MRLVVASCLIFVCARAWAAQNAAPENWPDDRYDALVNQWPFAVATPKEEPKAEPQASFATGWFLSGLSKIRNTKGEEVDFVSIRSQDRRDVFSLIGDEVRDGVSIASVDPSPLVGKSTVTLKKGTDFAKVEFNQMELQAAPAPGGAPPALNAPGVRPLTPGMPAAPGQPVNAVGNAQFNNGRPAIPRPPTTMAPGMGAPATNAIPRPAGAYPMPTGMAPGMNPAGGQPSERRKIRVINSRP